MTAQPVASSQNRRNWMPIAAGCAALAVCLCLAGSAGAGYLWLSQRGQNRGDQPAVEYILDASPRMALPAAGAAENATRLAVAQGVLAEIVRPADPAVTAGLRVFGNGALPVACEDTDLLVPLAPANQGAISDRALALQAGAAADAALAEAMIAAIRDLADPAGPHTLVVVTGGADSCNPEAGELVAREAERAGIDLQLFVVGYQVPDEDLDSIKGTVEDGGGTYLGAFTEDELRAILDAIQTYIDEDDRVLLDQVLALATPEGLATAVAEAGATATLSQVGTPAAATNTPGPGAATATTAAPTAAATDDLGYQSQTACDHPYIPLRQGATWTYDSSSGGFTWTVTEVTGDLNNAAATMMVTVPDGTITYHWTCTAEGVASYDFGSVAISTAEGSTQFEVVSSEGSWLPPASQLVPGASWTHAYTILMDFTGAGGGFTSETSQSFVATGFENMAVGAGSFESLRVDGTMHSTMSMPGGGDFDTDGTFVYWLAYGVGIVRSDNTIIGETDSSTLVSYSIP